MRRKERKMRRRKKKQTGEGKRKEDKGRGVGGDITDVTRRNKQTDKVME